MGALATHKTPISYPCGRRYFLRKSTQNDRGFPNAPVTPDGRGKPRTPDCRKIEKHYFLQRLLHLPKKPTGFSGPLLPPPPRARDKPTFRHFPSDHNPHSSPPFRTPTLYERGVNSLSTPQYGHCPLPARGKLVFFLFIQTKSPGILHHHYSLFSLHSSLFPRPPTGAG